MNTHDLNKKKPKRDDDQPFKKLHEKLDAHHREALERLQYVITTLGVNIKHLSEKLEQQTQITKGIAMDAAELKTELKAVNDTLNKVYTEVTDVAEINRKKIEELEERIRKGLVDDETVQLVTDIKANSARLDAFNPDKET